jgi:hypothetical protein
MAGCIVSTQQHPMLLLLLLQPMLLFLQLPGKDVAEP